MSKPATESWFVRCARATIPVALMACAFVMGSTRPADATVVADTPLEDMVAGAHAIVQGQVVRTGERVRVTQGGFSPERLTWIRPARWLKGKPQTPGELVLIREPGGTLVGETLNIEGAPRYHVGEEVIVFLEAAPDMSATAVHSEKGPMKPVRYWLTMNLALGKFSVSRGADAATSYVKRDPLTLSVATWRGGTLQIAPAVGEPPMQLDSFLHFVEGVLRAMQPPRSGGQAR